MVINDGGLSSSCTSSTTFSCLKRFCPYSTVDGVCGFFFLFFCISIWGWYYVFIGTYSCYCVRCLCLLAPFLFSLLASCWWSKVDLRRFFIPRSFAVFIWIIIVALVKFALKRILLLKWIIHQTFPWESREGEVSSWGRNQFSERITEVSLMRNYLKIFV